VGLCGDDLFVNLAAPIVEASGHYHAKAIFGPGDTTSSVQHFNHKIDVGHLVVPVVMVVTGTWRHFPPYTCTRKVRNAGKDKRPFELGHRFVVLLGLDHHSCCPRSFTGIRMTDEFAGNTNAE